MKRKTTFIALISVLLLIVIGLVGVNAYNSYKISQIENYEECAAAGFPIMESYPERCATPDGRTFTRDISGVGERVTYRGKMVCLPHKDRSGPVTLECAYGLETEDNKFHGLIDPMAERFYEFQIGDEVEVSGKIIDREEKIYDTVDTIEIESIVKL